jgi:hypothetical protein
LAGVPFSAFSRLAPYVCRISVRTLLKGAHGRIQLARTPRAPELQMAR